MPHDIIKGKGDFTLPSLAYLRPFFFPGVGRFFLFLSIKKLSKKIEGRKFILLFQHSTTSQTCHGIFLAS